MQIHRLEHVQQLNSKAKTQNHYNNLDILANLEEMNLSHQTASNPKLNSISLGNPVMQAKNKDLKLQHLGAAHQIGGKQRLNWG